jgi:glycosyltransferase involved in cell wall biosynthesis
VIWNGISAPQPEVPEEIRQLAASARGPIIGSISTLIPQKGLEYLLQAAQLLQSRGHAFTLLIAGEGRLRAALEEQSRSLGLQERVRFLGWVPEASRGILPVCDIFVQSSLWEAMSVVVLEAMAAGKAVVATSVGENVHVLDQERTGLLVQPRDPAALAGALARLLTDATLRAQLGQAAAVRYADEFTVEHMISRHQDLYERLIARRSKPNAHVGHSAGSPL